MSWLDVAAMLVSIHYGIGFILLGLFLGLCAIFKGMEWLHTALVWLYPDTKLIAEIEAKERGKK